MNDEKWQHVLSSGPAEDGIVRCSHGTRVPGLLGAVVPVGGLRGEVGFEGWRIFA